MRVRESREARKAGRQRPRSPVDDAQLRAFGLAILCAKVGLVPLALDPGADVSFVLPKTLLSHGLTYVLVAVLLGLVALNGWRSLSWRASYVPVALYAIVSTVAAVFAVNSTLAWSGSHERMLGLGSVLDGVVTFFAATQLVRTPVQLRLVVISLLVASGIVVGYEAIQKTGHDPFSWTLNGTERPFSTTGQPTTLGEYLAILAIGGLALAALAPALSRLVRAALVGDAAVLFAGAALTGTRSIALGVLASLAGFVLIVVAKHPVRRIRVISVVGAVMTLVIGAAIVFFTPVGARLMATVNAPPANVADETSEPVLEESAATRLEIYQIAADMLRERPALGYGPDNFSAGMPAHRPEPALPELRFSVVTSAHSWIASTAANTGILGLLAFGAILVVAAVELWRRSYAPIATVGAIVVLSYLGAGATSINAIETDSLFWLALAGVVGAAPAADSVAARGQSSAAPGRPRRPSTLQQVGTWALVATGVIMLASGTTAYVASRLAKQSVSMRTASTMNVAIDLATRATQLDPNRGAYWKQLALAYAGAGRFTEASAAFQRGALVEPYDIRFLTDDVQAQLLMLSRGDTAALGRAEQLAARAVAIDPRNPRAHSTRAQVAQARGDLVLAAREIERALVLDPGSLSLQLYMTAANIYFAAGRLDDVIAVSESGFARVGQIKESIPLRLLAAQALKARGRTAEALTQVQIVLALSPNDQTALQLLAQLR